MVYLKLPTILGSVKEKGYVGWLPVQALSQGRVDSPGQPDGLVGGSRARIVDYTQVSRRFDKNSRDIYYAMAVGQKFSEAKLAFLEPKGSKRKAYTCTMSDAVVSSYSAAGEDGGMLETFVLKFEKIRFGTV